MIAQLEETEEIPEVQVRMCFMGALVDAQNNQKYNTF